MELHERYPLVQAAESMLSVALIDWVSEHVEEWGWEQVVMALLPVEVTCLDEELRATETVVFENPDSQEAWDRIVKPWVLVNGLTWLEAARVLHHQISPYLNYALRGERHPGDETGEKKADEA